MIGFSRLNWVRGGVVLACAALVLVAVSGYSRRNGGTHGGIEAVGPLIARGYTDAPAASAVVAGRPEGGDVLVRLNVRAGDEVRKGQILAVLVNHAAAELDIARAKANLKRAETQETAMLTGFRVAEVAYQEITVKLTEADYRLKELELSRTTMPPDERALRLSLLLSRLDREKAKLAVQKQQLESDRARLRTELQILRNLLEDAEQSREAALVRAPFDGVVTDILTQPGELVTDRGILRIVDLDRIRVYADIDEIHLNRLREGGGAEFTLRGEGAVRAGRIARLPSTVKRTKRSEADFGDTKVRLAEIEIVPVDQANMAKMLGQEVRVVFH